MRARLWCVQCFVCIICAEFIHGTCSQQRTFASDLKVFSTQHTFTQYTTAYKCTYVQHMCIWYMCCVYIASRSLSSAPLTRYSIYICIHVLKITLTSSSSSTVTATFCCSPRLHQQRHSNFVSYCSGCFGQPAAAGCCSWRWFCLSLLFLTMRTVLCVERAFAHMRDQLMRHRADEPQQHTSERDHHHQHTII